MSDRFIGEVLGTFILVFIGCGIVGLSLFHPEINLMLIASVWGVAVLFGILVAVRKSQAHLNPAVSLAFLITGDNTFSEFLKNIAGQFVGAALAALVLFLLFNGHLADIESLNGWNRSDISGWNTARMFGEFYNPEQTTLLEAFFAEAFGTAILVYMIFIYVKSSHSNPKLVILFISLTVSILILFIAPITQCGINPARDLAPRTISFLLGWNKAFDLPDFGALLVYVVGPFTGASVAALVARTRQLLTIN